MAIHQNFLYRSEKKMSNEPVNPIDDSQFLEKVFLYN